MLDRIFEPLYRADESRDHGATPAGGAGQGIGLAITARVMELHGGVASAENRKGGGLKVTLRLPAGNQEPVNAGIAGQADCGYRL